MTIRPTLIASSLIVAALASGSAHAALQGRDLNGSAGSFEAYYDTVLDITWLANANMNGAMTRAAANTWAANLSFTDGVNVYDNWRLPTTTDTGTPGCNWGSGTDCGYNVAPASSEMAHLYFVTLGNQSYYTTTGAVSGAWEGGSLWDSTLDNTDPFINFDPYGHYWSSTEYAPNPSYAWNFNTYNGFQYLIVKTNSFYALAVSPGDVAAVPEAETYALMLAGLGLIGWRARRRG